MAQNNQENNVCVKCGNSSVDVSGICQTCNWDHVFKEYFGAQEEEEGLEEYREDEEEEN